MRNFFVPCFIFGALSLFGDEALALKRIQSHLVIADYQAAVQEGKEAFQAYPDSKVIREAYLKAISKSGDDKALMTVWKLYVEKFPEEKNNPEILELLAWGVIDKGFTSTTPIVRVTALLGAFFSQDAKGIGILKNALQDEHAFIRSAAVKLSSKLHDSSLQDELLLLLRREKVWKVRLEVIQALGHMRMEEAKPDLMKIVAHENLHVEEKTAAITSLVLISDAIDRKHLEKLVYSNRAGMRLLACELISHYEQVEDIDLLPQLINDSHADVRVKVLETIGRLRLDRVGEISVIEIATKGVDDPDPNVAVTAAWLLTLSDPMAGQQALGKFLKHSSVVVRHHAAAALAATGKYGLPLMQTAFQNESDVYVKMNLALGLIGQRIYVDSSCDCLYQGMSTQKERWAWNEEGTFRALGPSREKHDEAIPNYPEAVNQLTRLEILQILAVAHYPGAQKAIKEFLKESNWGITGLASALLLTEGDEDAVELVQGLLKDPDTKVRIQAALILSVWGRGEESVILLQNAYAKADRDLKGQILEGVGRVGSPISLTFLAECLQEPFQTLRIIAAASLLECLYH